MAIPFNLPSDEETENNYRSMDDLLMQLYQVLRQILLHRAPEQPATDNDLERNLSRPAPPCNAVRTDAVVSAASAVAPSVDELPRLPLPDIVLSTATSPTTTTTTPNRPVRQRLAASQTTTHRGTQHPLPPPRRGRRRRNHQQHPYPRTTSSDQEKTVVDETDCPTTTAYQYAAHCYMTVDPNQPDVVPKVAVPKVAVRDNWTQVGEDLRRIADEFHTSLQDFDHKPVPSVTSNQKGVSLLSLLVPAPFSGSVWMAVIFLLGWGVLQRSGR